MFLIYSLSVDKGLDTLCVSSYNLSKSVSFFSETTLLLFLRTRTPTLLPDLLPISKEKIRKWRHRKH